jgi:tRNA 2-thiouridine synthesizing protein A
MSEDLNIDARELLCPLPVLKLRKRLQGVPTGTILHLLTTDPAAIVDVPHFCSESGNELIDTTTRGDVTTYQVRKA